MATLNFPDFVKGEIYLISCTITDRLYIGQTKTHGYASSKNKWIPRGYLKRFEEHKSTLQYWEREKLTGLHAAMLKYGEENFNVELLHTCDIEELNDWEIFNIDWFDTYKQGYNLTIGGSYIPKDKLSDPVVRSKVSKERSELIRVEFLKDNAHKVSRISIEDNTTEYHAVVVWLYFTDGESIRWSYSDYQTNLWNCFERVYKTLSEYISIEKISVHLRLIYYLEGFADSKYQHLIQIPEQINETISTNLTDVDVRYERYKNYIVDYITIKLRRKHTTQKIAVCIKSPDIKREIVTEFGGEGITMKNAIDRAMEFVDKLTSRDRIFMRPELVSYLSVNNINIQWLPAIKRKPRILNKKE
jgi:hypothetical protein